MRGSKQDVPVTVEAGGVVIREAEWGDWNVSLESFPAGSDNAPLLKGLPDDLCQCPHIGDLVKGRGRGRYADHEEIINAGDAYYVPSGHSVLWEEDSEVVEFSPKGEYQKTLEVIGRNLAAMQHA